MKSFKLQTPLHSATLQKAHSLTIGPEISVSVVLVTDTILRFRTARPKGDAYKTTFPSLSGRSLREIKHELFEEKKKKEKTPERALLLLLLFGVASLSAFVMVVR